MRSIFAILIAIILCDNVSAQLDSSFSVPAYPALPNISDDLVDAEDHKIFSYVLMAFAGGFYYTAHKTGDEEWNTIGHIVLTVGVTVDIASTLKRRIAFKALRTL